MYVKNDNLTFYTSAGLSLKAVRFKKTELKQMGGKKLILFVRIIS